MAFDFLNLDAETRNLMIDEIDTDVEKGSLYISPRLSPSGRTAYLGLLRESASGGTEQTLADGLGQRGMLNAQETRQLKTGPIMADLPHNANEILAEGEFNRFYIRAICRRAIEMNQQVKAYRAKAVTNARSASEAMIGKTLDPVQILEDLRSSQGVDTALGLPPGPNSGISVHL